MCIRITLESGCCCHIPLPAGQGDKGSRKDGYVVELAILMCERLAICECFQNCNQEEQLAIIGPTLICKNHVINHTTYDTYTDTDTRTYMYMHMYVFYIHTGFWEFNAAYLKRLVPGERSQGSRWEKDKGSTKTIGHVRCFLDISGQKMVYPSKGPATYV